MVNKKKLKPPESLAELDDFANQCINSQEHTGDIHNFILFSCSECKSEALKLTIEHHTGSEKWDFKGILCNHNKAFVYTD